MLNNNTKTMERNSVFLLLICSVVISVFSTNYYLKNYDIKVKCQNETKSLVEALELSDINNEVVHKVEGGNTTEITYPAPKRSLKTYHHVLGMAELPILDFAPVGGIYEGEGIFKSDGSDDGKIVVPSLERGFYRYKYIHVNEFGVKHIFPFLIFIED